MMEDMKSSIGPDMNKEAPTMPQETWSEFAEGPEGRDALHSKMLEAVNWIPRGLYRQIDEAKDMLKALEAKHD